jgi:hypothetical protein
MKKLFCLLALAVLSSLCFAQGPLLPNLTGQEVNQGNAARFSSHDYSAESAVDYFIASIMLKDDRWKEVVAADCLEEVAEKVESMYSQVTFTKFKAQKQELIAGGDLWLTVFMEIEYNGESESDSDEFTLKYVGDHWAIADVPS